MVSTAWRHLRRSTRVVPVSDDVPDEFFTDEHVRSLHICFVLAILEAVPVSANACGPLTLQSLADKLVRPQDDDCWISLLV